ncbi:alpha/beta hydrolase-fold protein [Kineococcus arenarius]|uniref:alpha/beta hydrolase-fold protein n=1 Tax=unclassified Kineococcus TaxID=2621656 RepID=UPI003D7E3777
MSRTPRAVAALTLTAALVATTGSAGAAADASGEGPGRHGRRLGPVLTHTAQGPTGYTVTFRLSAPDAESVRIRGTWTFASSESTSTDPANSSPVAAARWRPGDFPLQSPNSPGENWAVAEMTEDPRTGVWSYTVPLPSGVFDYQFYADCDAAAGSVAGCTATTDPVNPAWSTTGSVVPFSQVYVPSDAAFGTVDRSWQADAPARSRGTLAEVVYETPNATSGVNRAVVYTPPGYDEDREAPYPVFVLSHGGGENEMAWSTRGRLAQVLDNLIARGEVQPMVVVMPDGSDLVREQYTTDVSDVLLPHVEQRYHVSGDAADRAFAGTSAFGTKANEFLFEQTEEFGYYGVWSPAAGAPPVTVTGQGDTPVDPAYTQPALQDVLGIHLAIGEQDLGGNAPMLTTTTEREGLINAGVPFTYFTEPGGHTWDFWRDALRDFLTRVAFRTTSTTLEEAGGAVVATVTAAGTPVARPTGTVRFLVDGVEVGGPVRLQDGRAELREHSGGEVTAVYSGDANFNASTSADAPTGAS